jgi:hypothetical protein
LIETCSIKKKLKSVVLDGIASIYINETNFLGAIVGMITGRARLQLQMSTTWLAAARDFSVLQSVQIGSGDHPAF